MDDTAYDKGQVMHALVEMNGISGCQGSSHACLVHRFKSQIPRVTGVQVVHALVEMNGISV